VEEIQRHMSPYESLWWPRETRGKKSDAWGKDGSKEGLESIAGKGRMDDETWAARLCVYLVQAVICKMVLARKRLPAA
jgi:hypothetical protein